jgi:hypothetical protein
MIQQPLQIQLTVLMLPHQHEMLLLSMMSFFCAFLLYAAARTSSHNRQQGCCRLGSHGARDAHAVGCAPFGFYGELFSDFERSCPW